MDVKRCQMATNRLSRPVMTEQPKYQQHSFLTGSERVLTPSKRNLEVDKSWGQNKENIASQANIINTNDGGRGQG